MQFYNKIKTYMIRKMKWEMKDLEIGYEKKYDILGILIPEKDYKIEDTIEVEAGFLIDVDKKGKIVQIEIHNVCDRINESKKYIEDANIEVYVDVYDFSYLITVDFNDGEKQIKQRILR